MASMKPDKFAQAYIEAALWSSMDNSDENTGGSPMDSNYGPEDIAPETLAKMAEDCRQFQADNEADLSKARSTDYNGHDFWLTRNGHGVGFWDRDLGDVGERLTDASEAWGTFDLYVGDDGQIWGQ